MAILVFKSREIKESNIEEMIKRLDMQYTQLAYELERIRNLSQKIREIDRRLKAIEEMIKEYGVKIPPRTASKKTKETIKVLIQKYKALTAEQLGKLLKLSRTRCSEYLKGMEEEGILVSETRSRKKYYMLRQ